MLGGGGGRNGGGGGEVEDFVLCQTLLMQKCLLGTAAAKVKLLPQFKNFYRVTTSDKCRRVPKGADFYFIFYHSTGNLECRNASWMCRSFRQAALTN